MTTFWSDRSLEPKRSYKYLMTISNPGMDYIIKTTDKPSFEVSETEHQFLNHTYYYPGRVTWSEIKVTMVDPAEPDASATLQQLLFNSGYNLPHSEALAKGKVITKKRAADALGTVYIKQIGNSASDIIEEWRLYNAWIKDVEFGSLDYGSDDMVEISLTLRYDFAQLTKTKGGVFEGLPPQPD